MLGVTTKVQKLFTGAS